MYMYSIKAKFSFYVLKSSAKSGVFCLKSLLEAVLALETTVIWR